MQARTAGKRAAGWPLWLARPPVTYSRARSNAVIPQPASDTAVREFASAQPGSA